MQPFGPLRSKCGQKEWVMSDANEEFEDDVTEEAEKSPVRVVIKGLKAQNKELNAKLVDALAAQRELAFVKAGVNPDLPMAKYFMKGYDGEFTPEAIHKAAIEANLTGVKKDEMQVEKQAWGRLTEASRSGEASEPIADWNAKIRNANSQDEVMQILAQSQQASQNI